MVKIRSDMKGFTIVELLVAILIFTIGGLSAYLLVYTAINSSIRSKNEMIGGNLAREKLELVKNIRDSNWIRLLDWNKLDGTIVKMDSGIGDHLIPGYYKIENDYQNDLPTAASISIKRLSGSFTGKDSELLNPADSGDQTRFCLDNKGRYTYDCTPGNQKTQFYGYLKIEDLKTKDSIGNRISVDNAYKITASIISTQKSFSRFEISTIITDWKR